jgi:hypothetical protein
MNNAAPRRHREDRKDKAIRAGVRRVACPRPQ